MVRFLTSNAFAINGIEIPNKNSPPCERCVTVLNYQSDKKPSPNPLRVPPLQHFSAHVDKWIGTFHQAPDERPKAHKTRAFELNNVLDLAERISFFWHRRYEKYFLGSLQNVLSSSVKRVKRLTYKCRQINGDL